MSYTVDDNTEASAPGQITICRKKYLDYTGITGFKNLAYSLLLTLPQETPFRFFRKDNIVFGWIKKTEHFRSGCVNPSLIINAEKGLIATFTDLRSRGSIPVPVVKISQEKLWLVRNEKLHNGKKTAAVALYYQNAAEPYASAWMDFNPLVPNCFTNDAAACAALVEGISENAWTCLRLGLEQLPAQNKVGLFRVNLDAELVNNA